MNPGAKENCSTVGVDDNCSEGADETGAVGCVDYWFDEDSDGYGVGDATCLCAPEGQFSAPAAGDCAPNNTDVSPGAVELCDDIDNDCGGVDNGCDDDGDDWCDGAYDVIGEPEVCQFGSGDCDDEDPFTSPGALEVCDAKDNDCKNGADDGVQSPCGGCSNACVLGAGSGSESPFTHAGEGTTIDGDGNVIYDVNSSSLAMLWIANSAEGTISRLDTETGKEVARYGVCANPSRTAVDAVGNCWVACRGDGHVVQIRRRVSDCKDANGNGVIETSQDVDGNGAISPDEMMPFGEDECIGHDVHPENGNARALAIDPAGDIWVGYWETRKLYRITDSGETATVTATVELDDTTGRPYGLAADNKGRLWIAMRNNRLGMLPILPEIGTFQQWATPGNPYGVAIDGNGVIWLAGGEGEDVMWFDPAEGVVHDIALTGFGKTRGVAISLEGDLYVAHHTWTCQNTATARWLTRINTETKTVTGQIDLGGMKGPIGLGIGFGGTLWSVNQCSNTVQRLNASTGEITGEFPVGNSPYTYSDMTGYQLRAIVLPQGRYSEVFEGWKTGTTKWTTANAVVTLSPGAAFSLAVRVADTVEGLEAKEYVTVATMPGGTLPVDIAGLNLTGQYLEAQVTFFMQDAVGSPVLEKIEIGGELLP
ncbi:MAG: streptogramin lyase [Myxococcota bacterium]